MMHYTNNKQLANPSRRRCALTPPITAVAQRGVVLFVALITLVIMTLAAIALVRSVNTGNVIAGNMAFRQGGMQASDLGVEAALAALPGIIAGGVNSNVTGATFQYYATRRIEDTAGLPTIAAFGQTDPATAINWSTVPAMTTTGNGYTVRVVIERLCRGANNAVITDVQQFCVADLPVSANVGNSEEVGETVFTSSQQIYYRATVQVAGPRNSINYIQSILAI